MILNLADSNLQKTDHKTDVLQKIESPTHLKDLQVLLCYSDPHILYLFLFVCLFVCLFVFSTLHVISQKQQK